MRELGDIPAWDRPKQHQLEKVEIRKRASVTIDTAITQAPPVLLQIGGTHPVLAAQCQRAQLILRRKKRQCGVSKGIAALAHVPTVSDSR